MDSELGTQGSGFGRCLEEGLPDDRKKTLFEDAIRNNEKLQPMIQQHRIMQSTVARMTGVAITDIEFTGFYDFVVNQAKEIDNLELKAKRQKSLMAGGLRGVLSLPSFPLPLLALPC